MEIAGPRSLPCLVFYYNADDRAYGLICSLPRLGAATEVEVIRHYELSSKLEKADGAPWSISERNRMEKEVAECENRRQALTSFILQRWIT